MCSVREDAQAFRVWVACDAMQVRDVPLLDLVWREVSKRHPELHRHVIRQD